MQHELCRLRSELRLQRGLVVGAIAVSLACAAGRSRATIPSAEAETKPTVLDVQRINIREPDGTLRVVLSNDALAPGPVVGVERGEEDDRVGGNAAGLVFYNEKGIENGALYIEGESVGLSLDRHLQDQTLVLAYGEEEQGYFSGLILYERPDYPHAQTLDEVDELAALPEAERRERIRQMQGEGAFGLYRMIVAKDEHDAALIELADRSQRPRIRMSVDADGEARLVFLDESGNETYALPPPT